MGKWSIGPKGLIVLSIHILDPYLLSLHCCQSGWALWEICETVGYWFQFPVYFGMDGPNVNLSFEDKLMQKLFEVDRSFPILGSCSLHPVHSAF